VRHGFPHAPLAALEMWIDIGFVVRNGPSR
jgi:hypothetical protein